jgi:hypothetical protein
MKTKKRVEQLGELEIVLIGSEYRGKKNINKDFNVHIVEVNCDPDEVWNPKIEKMKTELEKRKKVSRPITAHKHTEGEWRCESDGNRQFNIISKDGWNLLNNESDFDKQEANAKLMVIAPKLLEIAEMFFDKMKGTDAEGSLPFNIVLETLNKLK